MPSLKMSVFPSEGLLPVDFDQSNLLDRFLAAKVGSIVSF